MSLPSFRHDHCEIVRIAILRAARTWLDWFNQGWHGVRQPSSEEQKFAVMSQLACFVTWFFGISNFHILRKRQCLSDSFPRDYVSQGHLIDIESEKVFTLSHVKNKFPARRPPASNGAMDRSSRSKQALSYSSYSGIEG